MLSVSRLPRLISWLQVSCEGMKQEKEFHMTADRPSPLLKPETASVLPAAFLFCSTNCGGSVSRQRPDGLASDK